MWAMSKAALLAVKLLLPKLYPYIAMIVGTIAVLAVVYTMGKSSAEKRLTVERLNAENAELRATIQKHRAVIEADNKIAAENEERLADLEAQSRKVIEGVKDPTSSCLDADDTDRLRELWGTKD